MLGGHRSVGDAALQSAGQGAQRLDCPRRARRRTPRGRAAQRHRPAGGEAHDLGAHPRPDRGKPSAGRSAGCPRRRPLTPEADAWTVAVETSCAGSWCARPRETQVTELSATSRTRDLGCPGHGRWHRAAGWPGCRSENGGDSASQRCDSSLQCSPARRPGGPVSGPRAGARGALAPFARAHCGSDVTRDRSFPSRPGAAGRGTDPCPPARAASILGAGSAADRRAPSVGDQAAASPGSSSPSSTGTSSKGSLSSNSSSAYSTGRCRLVGPSRARVALGVYRDSSSGTLRLASAVVAGRAHPLAPDQRLHGSSGLGEAARSSSSSSSSPAPGAGGALPRRPARPWPRDRRWPRRRSRGAVARAARARAGACRAARGSLTSLSS